MERPKEITIAGAGLVGSMLAVLLGQRGYRVRIIEKRGDLRSQHVDGGRSINLALAERGIHALRKANLMSTVQPLLIPMRGRMLHDRSGDLEFFPYGQRPDEIIYSVSRTGLNKVLLDAAESSQQVSIGFECRLDEVDFESRTLLISRKGQQESLNYEILIAADGAGSKVRRALLAQAGGNDDSELLNHCYKELTIEAGPSGEHVLKREALHIWPRGGYMLIALPNLDGSFTLTLFLHQSGNPSFTSLTTAQAVRDFFKDQFPDADQLLPDLENEFFANPTGILGTVRCDQWTFPGSAMLIGDAAHAMVPFHGQGMNAGFEDCVVFVDLLDANGHDWAKAMWEFEQIRKPDATAICDMALENYQTMRDSVTDPNFQLKKELGFALERRFPDRFIPKYSMVMFTRIPYAEAYRRGQIQERILEQLLAKTNKLDSIDLDFAKKLVLNELSFSANDSNLKSANDG